MTTIIVFAGGETPPRQVVADIPDAGLVVAANGGYDIAAALGWRVDVVIGDLDSVLELPSHVLVEKHPTDKDATDLELTLDMVRRDGPERVVVIGGTGGRHDHEIANAMLLCSDRYSSIDEIDWISARARAHVVRRRRLLHGDIGTLVGLIPINGAASGVTTSGLRWNLEDATLESGTTRGVSNLFESPVADVRVKSGVLLAVLPSAEGSATQACGD